jgi:hypothetical protein
MLEGTDAVKVLGLPPVSSGPELSEFEIVSVGVRTGPTATILTFLLEFVKVLLPGRSRTQLVRSVLGSSGPFATWICGLTGGQMRTYWQITSMQLYVSGMADRKI